MKGKNMAAAVIAALSLTLLSACNAMQTNTANSSLKTLGKPYIAQYECTEARLGDTDLLKSFEYVKIIFLNKNEFELTFKPNGGDKKIFKGNYSVDPVTRELESDISVLGHKFKEKTKIENGRFTVSKTLGGKELFVLFEVK